MRRRTRLNFHFFWCQNRLVEVKIQWSEENLIIASDFKYYVIVLGRQRKNWQTSLSYFASGSSISLSSWFIGFKADWRLSFASAVILRISKAQRFKNGSIFQSSALAFWLKFFSSNIKLKVNSKFNMFWGIWVKCVPQYL